MTKEAFAPDQTGARPASVNVLSWLVALSVAIVSAAGTSWFAFYKEDVAVRVANWFVSGPLTGEWEVTTFEFDDGSDPKLVPSSAVMSVRQLSFRIIGETRTLHKSWTVSGYYNQPFLALADVSASGTAGLGSFTGKAVPEGNVAFLGTHISVNCKGKLTTPVLLRCPAILSRQGHGQVLSKYRSFLDVRECEEIVSDYATVARACPRPSASG